MMIKRHLISVILALVIGISFLKLSKPAIAQLDLYGIPKEIVYPRIYIPNRIITVQDVDSMFDDLKNNSQFINAYIVDEKIPSHKEILDKLPKIKYSQLNSNLYLLKIDAADENKNTNIILNEAYHKGWELKKISATDINCSNSKISDKFLSEECIGNYSWIDILKLTFTGESIQNSTHFVANDQVNGWTFQPTDGIYVISFAMQKYLLLGILISVIILISTVTYITAYTIRRVYKISSHRLRFNK